AAKSGGQAHAEADADRNHVDSGRTAICKGRNGKAKRRQGHEHILKFLHNSPASLKIDRQWVVEAHRAGPLTLAAFRGAERKRSPPEFFPRLGRGLWHCTQCSCDTAIDR